MIVGLIIALVGALVGLIGSLVLPWLNADVVGFQGEQVALLNGTAWPTGIAAMVLVAVCIALLGLALAMEHRRKLLVILTISLSAAALALAFITPFFAHGVIADNIRSGVLPPETHIAMSWGFHFIFFGIVILAFGCAWVLGSVGSYKLSDKVLRVAHLWHGRIVHETTFTERRPIRVGGDAGCDFVIPLGSDPESTESVILLKPLPDDKASVLLGGMKGRVNIGSTLMTPEEAVRKFGNAEVTIDKGDWGTLDFGFNQVFFNYVHPDVVIGRGGAFKSHEGVFVAALVGSAVFAVAFWLTAQLAWDPLTSIDRRPLDTRLMKVEAAVGKEKDEPIPVILEEEEEVVEQSDDRFGDPTAPAADAGPRRDSAMSEKVDVKNIGLADLLSNKLGKSGAMSAILSNDTDQFENAMAVAMEGTESDLTVGNGAGGWTFKGTGASGGGTGGYGRLHGLGNVDTGGGMGMRAGLGKKGTKKVGTMKIDGMTGSSFCQKANIEAVVKQRAGAIRACYEKQLQIKEGLSGKIAVRWTINLEGRVDSASVTTSTMGNAQVESCILGVIRRMRFENPKGGICVVQWPFVFSPG
ncbi:MAG TPA: TonB family protein [Myxococcota bacterium]|nr:TonB family protein [Myxococcota bacterium]